MPHERLWRKLVKKQQRQRRRQKFAREREKQQALEQSVRELDPEYQQWLKEQTDLEEFQRLSSERIQQEQEEAWLRREALAQRQFQLDAAKRRQQEAEIERLRMEQAKELVALEQEQRNRRLQKERLAEEAAAQFETMIQRMQDYMDDTEESSPPAELQRVVETHPEERLCEFFTRTNCCRYGHTCTFNHKRPMLAKIILIRHFFTHPLLQTDHSYTEYAEADEQLELTSHDLRAAYNEFFNDVVTELKTFGKIVNFRAVCNTLSHLRGNVFVEYSHERFALRAFINLQGRYYASKRLSVEFSNLKTWRGAVCGLSLTRKCPKRNSCGYLHLFRNPNNQFNDRLGPNKTPDATRVDNKTPRPKTPSWNDIEKPARNWRWSESPEVELQTSTSKPRRSESNHRSRHDRSHDRHNSKHSCKRSRSKSSRSSTRSRSPHVVSK